MGRWGRRNHIRPGQHLGARVGLRRDIRRRRLGIALMLVLGFVTMGGLVYLNMR